MDTLPIAMIIAADAVSSEVNSAQPDAPVVPYVVPTRLRTRTFPIRAVLAAVLRRAADVVAPADCSPATR